MLGIRPSTMEDIVACSEINTTMYMRSARRLRSTRHCRSPGKELGHTTHQEEREIGQHEEDKGQAKENGIQKVRKEKENRARSYKKQHLPIRQIGTHFASKD